ncbi:AlbA family DNA-binding domain-containing protein [Aequorivita marina]|uniref:AlbA family DNA-binding domain-containing protein n=1 Tax=Aequorivita marina TaxID=3073654 RepID=UPI002875D3EC|nr:ATP-binding protein [Aequorivita sp. S2608]MDS1297036.1 ATP-binding protein [Aequorivita sp. S2608]
MKSSSSYRNIKTILTHLLIGAGIFYFLVHPFTMVLYWFEYSDTTFSFPLFQEILIERFLESFTFDMQGMGGLLTLLGGFLGIVSGLFWINLKKKNELIGVQQRLLVRDIEELIESGENERVEFKSSIRYDYYRKSTNRDLEVIIAKTITGFMNAKGGKLIIGVDDEGNVLGLEKDYKTLKHKNRDGYERAVFRIISTQLGHEACFSNHISFYDINEKDVCVVDIEPSEKPIYVNDTENTTFYVRTGNATYPLTVKEAVNYLENRKQ